MTIKVTLDPGHGGSDPGALGSHAKEKNVNLAVALQMAKYLTSSGLQVRLTRKEDRFVSLSDRAAAANANRSDYFVSIHANAGGGRGTEVFAYSATGKASQLAASIVKEIAASLGLANRGVKYANFAVLRLTTMAAVLVETAFIDNAQEESLLTNPAKQDQLGKAIARGFLSYVGVALKEPGAPTPTPEPTPKPAENPYLAMNLKSKSGVSGSEIANFIHSVYSDSPLAALGENFVAAERVHGVNALFLMALAIHEAGWHAASKAAQEDKNLFGYHLGRPDGLFTSWEECIDKVAAAIVKNYLSPGGPYFKAPTLLGMSANYSTDPDWASGVASLMLRMRPVYREPLPWQDTITPDSNLTDAFMRALVELVQDIMQKAKG